MSQKEKIYNLGTFFCLYIAQTIPMSFFTTVLPVIMRQENFSLSAIGLLQLIKLPWILKFIWSPWVDRHTVTTADFKRWIISSELMYAAFIFVIAFLDFKIHFILILGFILLSCIASATQDIATDALAVLSFNRKDKSLVNSMQSMGSFGGSLVGSGILLLLFNRLGWLVLLPCLTLFVVVAILPLWMNKQLVIHREKEVSRATKKDLIYFFTQKGIYKQVLFLLLVYSGLTGILTMIKPWLVDLGYDMAEIGFMNGIVGTFTGFTTSFMAGFIVRSMGRFRSRILFATVILLIPVYFWWISSGIPSTGWLYGGICLLWGGYGMATIVVYTTAMDCVRPGREGTDFTIQTVLTHISSMVVAVSSGKVADMFGYRGLFRFEILLAALSLVYILAIFKRNQSIIDEAD